MKQFFALSFFSFFFLSLYAQSIQITQHDLSSYFTSTNFLRYAEAGNGDIWLLYSYLANGTSNFEMLVYDGMTWDTVGSPVCAFCIRDMVSGPEGKIWLAASDEGIWRRDDSVWTQVLTDAALKLTFDPQDQLVFINSAGLSVYDGTTVTPGMNMAAPTIPTVNQVLYDQNGLLWILLPGNLYTYDGTVGWVQKTDPSGPLYIDLRSDNRLYIADSFGYMNYYENGAYTFNAISGVYPNGLGFTAFKNDKNDVFWNGVQGGSPGLIRYDGMSDTLIAEADLTVDGILINELFVASNNDKWVASRSSGTVAKIVDAEPSTGIFSELAENFVFQLQPNPTRDMVSVSFSLEQPSVVSLDLYDLSGSLLKQVETQLGSGQQDIRLDLEDLPAGMYMMRAATDDRVGMQKLVIGK